ncbi:TPA: hypothetical protein ACN2KD_002752, partial [Staphylococcus aureus]
EMLLDGVPNELINTWLDKDIITPFSIRNDEINFKTKDIWDALIHHNWYYSN